MTMVAVGARLPLQGDRVRVRAFVSGDIQPHYVSWLNDPEVVRFSNQRFVRHTEASCRQYFVSFEGTRNSFLAIVDRGSGRMIGTMTVYRNTHHRTADIGLLIGARECWGQGFGREAFSLVLNWLLCHPEIRKVTAGALGCNVGMIRIMERSGLCLEATRRAHELVDGCPNDVVYYARFNDGA